MKKILLFLTNNRKRSSHEVEFDIIFFLVAVITVVVGVPLLLLDGERGFAAIVILWFLEFWDNLRHNRE